MPARQILLAILICGVLDIGYAILTSVLINGGTASNVLNFVAAGPFGERFSGTSGALVGLVVHFAIMSVMVLTYFAASRFSLVGSVTPWLAGSAYGVVLYLVMYVLVLPLRWPTLFPQSGLMDIGIGLFPHVALVGIPLAFMVERQNAALAIAGQ